MVENAIRIRTALMPAYYKDFHCIMGACQDNCCDNGWKIEFSKKDYLTIKRAVESEALKGMMSLSLRRLREREHDGMYAELRISEAGRCAFHTQEGLCRLQQECGEAALPLVCRTYPRRRAYSCAALEYSLVPSCEGVLSLLWDLPDGVDFIEEALPVKEHKTLRPQSPVEARFAPIRSLWIDALQARSLPLGRRLLLLGLLCQQLQALDWTDGAAADRYLAQGAALVAHPSALASGFPELPRNHQLFLSNNLQLLMQQFQTLGPVLSSELLRSITGAASPEALTGNITIDAGRYRELEAKLKELLGSSEYFLENLMVTIVFTMAFPTLKTPENMWKSYVNLCILYSFYRFVAVCAMDADASRQRLFHALVNVGRSLLHNPKQRSRLRDELFQNNSASLAHMAILVGG